MLEVRGKWNQAKIFTDTVDQTALAQVLELCNQEGMAQSKIRMMPDIHPGRGCTVGTTMTIQDCVIPNLVGVDIGCGVETVRIRERYLELQKLDKLIYQTIPFGFQVREKAHPYADRIDLTKLHCAPYIRLPYAEHSVGTLGGGNHFIEVDQDEEGRLYLIVHSGSRHLGVEVAEYYQNLAYQQLNGTDEDTLQQVAYEMRQEGHEKAKIDQELKRRKHLKQTSVPKHMAYLMGESMKRYLQDMKLVQDFAALNRRAIVDQIVRGMKLHVEEQFSTIHNYVDTKEMILRKGAVSAQQGERILIPINMRDGSLICVGKGNQDWNCSAPHGMGRVMGRAQAKESFTVSQFRKEMKKVYSTSVGASTLDECPMAYKEVSEILLHVDPTLEMVKRLFPIYNFKAGDQI